MFDKVNLERALLKIREEETRKESVVVLDGFKRLFQADWEWENRISNTLQAGATSGVLLSRESLDSKQIFTDQTIKKLCLKYRLRFLSTKYFKGQYPLDAIAAVKKLESLTDQKIDAFMMVAPSARFTLEDTNKDPLLFAPLSDGTFYLIHQWGNDLSAWRKLLAWPAKCPKNLLIAVVVLSLISSALIPTSWLSDVGRYFNFYRTAFFFWNVIFLSAITCYFWFATSQRFGVESWRSHTFN